eukprot:COSAG01_NODE_373_length_17991_cov_284.890075_6_plen_47_part_00
MLDLRVDAGREEGEGEGEGELHRVSGQLCVCNQAVAPRCTVDPSDP